jgi:hypothetical protein
VRWLGLVIVLAGCNNLLGLDPTLADSADSDRDGVLDLEDSCPGLANPDQADADGDGIGDRCDPSPDGLTCPAGTRTGGDADGNGIDDGCEDCGDRALDEDSDGVPDGCDRCPGFADAAQPDGDGDGVGDACDPSTAIQQRRLFDGFTEGALRPQWIAVPGWGVGAGVLDPAPGSARLELVFSLGGAASGDWSVTVGVNLPAVTDASFDGQLVGISIFAELEPAKEARCGLLFNSTQNRWFMNARDRGTPGTTVPFDGPLDQPIPVRMSLREKAGTFGFTCEILGAVDLLLAIEDPIMAAPVRAALASQIDATFSYADVIQ